MSTKSKLGLSLIALIAIIALVAAFNLRTNTVEQAKDTQAEQQAKATDEQRVVGDAEVKPLALSEKDIEGWSYLAALSDTQRQDVLTQLNAYFADVPSTGIRFFEKTTQLGNVTTWYFTNTATEEYYTMTVNPHPVFYPLVGDVAGVNYAEQVVDPKQYQRDQALIDTDEISVLDITTLTYFGNDDFGVGLFPAWKSWLSEKKPEFVATDSYIETNSVVVNDRQITATLQQGIDGKNAASYQAFRVTFDTESRQFNFEMIAQ